MNIYEEKPVTGITKLYDGWLTAIHLDARELTAEEREAHGIEEGKAAWTSNDTFHKTSERPTDAELRAMIEEAINKRTDELILSGFVWRGMPVWLSMENQFNYKGAYDIAVQMNGATLPVTFKVGERDGHPVYFTFNDMETFSDFYFSAIAYKDKCLKDGWAAKDSIEL